MAIFLRQIHLIRAIYQHIRVAKQLINPRQLQHIKLVICISTKYHH